MAALPFEYDPAADIATICGRRYAGEFFRTLAGPAGSWFRIESSVDGGWVTVFSPDPETAAQFDLATQSQRTGGQG